MKKVLLTLTLILVANQLWAQRDIEITAFSGYTFKNTFDIYGGRARIDDGHTYGGMLAVEVTDGLDVEFMYSRQNTVVTAYSAFMSNDVNEDANVVYYMIGGTKTFETMNSSLNFFTGMKLGGVTIASQEDDFDSVSKFAAGLNGGVKYFITDKLGIKLAMLINFPIVDVGAGLWFGTGGGGVGVSTWSPIVQFNMQGGLFFRISN